ncbi:MAG: hypothetical protein P4L28_11940 [Paludibacteraceae bacterium]|nr:hypothetical protein [Paludibacteraceae bacterium]
MYELYIQDKNNVWQLADLGSEKPAINIQRNDIGELKDRQTDYSQAVKLPKTPNNCRIFSFINEFTVESDLRHKRMECRLYCDGCIILGNGGLLKFVQITNFFEVQLLGGIMDFFAQLAEKNSDNNQKTLNDLNFSSTIVRGLSGFQISQSPETHDMFFGIADFASEPNMAYSYSKGNRSVFQECQYPFVWLKTIINQILCENGGYTLCSDILTDNEYAKACMTLTSIKTDLSTYLKMATVSYNGIPFTNSSQRALFIVPFSFTDSISCMRVDASVPFEIDSYNQNLAYNGRDTVMPFLVFKVPTSGVYKLKIGASAHSSDRTPMQEGTGALTTIMYFFKNPEDISSHAKVQSDDKTSGLFGTLSSVSTNNGSYDIATINGVVSLDLKQGDKLVMIWMSNSYIQGTVSFDSFSCNVVNFYPKLTKIDTFVGGSITLKKNLPDITQYDFFKYFLQQYGLTVDVDIEKKKVNAYTFNTVVQNKLNAKDWSEKYDKGTGTVKFVLGNYEKNNKYAYKDEDNSIDSSNIYTEMEAGLAEYMFNKGKSIYYTAEVAGALNKMDSTFVYGQAEYYIVGVELESDELNFLDQAF